MAKSNSTAEHGNTVRKGSKRKARAQIISVSYINEMPDGALETVLADIYAKKIRNGKLQGYTA